MAQSIEVFISYAHEDEALRKRLGKHLQALRRLGLIDTWYDGEISAGTPWAQEIETHLNTARVILLLISPDFMDSDYCYGIEMRRAIERHERGEARVIPILLRPAQWQNAPFGKLQALPPNVRAITTWTNRDKALLDVAKGIEAAINEMRGTDAPGAQAPSKRSFEPVEPYSPAALPHQVGSNISITHLPSTPAVQAPLDAPFHFHVPLPHLEAFCGRTRERDALISRTLRGGSTSIVGARGSGKTWLGDYLRLMLPTRSGSHFCFARLDAMVPKCHTEAEFTKRVLTAFGERFSESQGHELSLNDVEEFVKKQKEASTTPILYIDEFERLLERERFDCDFYKGLRSLTGPGIGLVLVIASKSSLKELVGKRCEGSGFFNVFNTIKLKSYDKADAEQFIEVKSGQAVFTPHEREALLKYGRDPQELGREAWSPLRLQLVGELLFQDKNLATTGHPRYYRPDDANYWQEFEERLEGKYREVAD